MIHTQRRTQRRARLTAGILLALIVSCTGTPAPLATPIPTVSPSAASAAPAALATNVPILPATATAVAKKCDAPSIAGTIDLMPLPGPVREPVSLARLNGRTYVAGHASHNLGIVENDRLVGMLPAGDKPLAVAADESLGRLYVLSEGDLSVSALDGQALLATIPISDTALQGYQYAADMIGDPQNHRLFVGLISQRPEVVVVDGQTLAVSARLPMSSSDWIGSLALDASSGRLLVRQARTVSVFDVQSQKQVERFDLQNGSDKVLLYDARSGRLYADYYENGNYIAVIDNGTQVASLPVGADPAAGLIVNDRLYVSNNYSSTVSVLDLKTNLPLATIPVGLTPGALVADASGEHIYVAVTGAYGREINRLDVIDARRNEVTGIVPLAVQVSQLVGDGSRQQLYALVPSANSVFIVDGQRVVTQVALAGTPTRMAIDDSAGRLYVADFLSGEVTVVDAAAGAVVERRTLDNPTRQDAIEVDRAHNRLLLSNRSFSLDRLEPTGHYSITGFTIPYGEGILPDTLLANPGASRFYATASNGIAGSNGGTIVYAIDGDTLKQVALNGDRNVTSVALDASAQRLYASASHPLALTHSLNVLDARSLDSTASLGLPARAAAMVVNPATHHLFLTYSSSYRPAPADNTLQVLDTRTLGMVVSLGVDAEPAAIGLLGDLVYVASKTRNPLTVVRDCPGEPPPAPTSTPSPTAYPTLPPEATSTAKPATTARPPGPIAPAPTSCAMATASWLKVVLEQHDELRAALGCPSELPRATQMAEQPFQNGLMVWLEDTRKIYVLRNEGTWSVYDDTWDETQPEGGFYTPPPGLREPVRGFGKVWREQLGGPNAAIGWATAREVGLNGQAQGFAAGLALGNDRGTRVLLANGTWRQ